MRLRLHEAKGLLTQTDVSIIEVALRSGFKNASHFTRRYRKMYQMLPSEQRKL
jgi:transcriptional regulator GlxA family with amidase domain